MKYRLEDYLDDWDSDFIGNPFGAGNGYEIDVTILDQCDGRRIQRTVWAESEDLLREDLESVMDYECHVIDFITVNYNDDF
tara:strand:+ start:661 stop:903 length:243 start_codon:yes stop_codon:yes gene_type:complete